VKVVLDANVLLAAYGFGGTCYDVLELCLARHEIVLSDHILSEFREHLHGKFGADEQWAQQLSDRLRSTVTVVVPAVEPNACSDPDGLPVLGTLVAASGDCLVTGDRDLLDLGAFSGRPILSPREFLDRQS
jgi:putative PIN family toxin of toxin-antitoxin system